VARIRAHGLVVEFPIYGASGRSLKNAVMRAATGGLLAKDASERIVVRALNGVSFELREGDRVGLVGHNGSGKTTLLRVLAGAYEPVAGTIEIEGRVASMLSISLGMDPEATGHENIFLRAAIMGMRPHEIAPLIEEIREFSELGDYIHMPLRTYSSGMAMRLAFAISTCVTADIILMDEWLSVGDAGFAKKAQERLARVLDRAKIMVLASHNEELIRDNCNRVIRLDHGEIIAVEDLGAQAAALRPMMPVPAAAT
jgi:lipopolysaccharide transport system ATP-binding protein